MKEFDELLEIMQRLRDREQGCPWDLQQTYDSLKPHLIEETYEIIEAIDKKDYQALKEELGDLLLHIVFQSQMAEEDGHFNIKDVLTEINKKMMNRHPHIFSDKKVENAEEVVQNWEKIKKNEKKYRESILDGIPKGLPALIKANRIQEKASAVGFDWKSAKPIFDKLQEELKEFQQAYQEHNNIEMEKEIGDILFTIVNIARQLDIDPEFALQNTVEKFIQRFRTMENYLKKENKDISHCNLDELEILWERAKKDE